VQRPVLSSNKFDTCVRGGQYSDWVSNVAAAGAKANAECDPNGIRQWKKRLTARPSIFSADKFKAAVERG
jgi:hypothetical protein